METVSQADGLSARELLKQATALKLDKRYKPLLRTSDTACHWFHICAKRSSDGAAFQDCRTLVHRCDPRLRPYARTSSDCKAHGAMSASGRFRWLCETTAYGRRQVFPCKSSISRDPLDCPFPGPTASSWASSPPDGPESGAAGVSEDQPGAGYRRCPLEPASYATQPEHGREDQD